MAAIVIALKDGIKFKTMGFRLRTAGDEANFYRVETSRWDLSKYNPMIQKPLDNSDGSLHLTNAPGHGVEMNMDYLRENAIEGFPE